MTDKNLIWNKTSAFVGIIAIVITIGVSWYFNQEKSTILNIEKVSEILLTKPLDVEGLTVSYMFYDSIEVKNLWRTTFVIRNVGNKTIYGKGFPEQSIRQHYIPLFIENGERILSAVITNENNGAFMLKPLQLIISQWRPREFVEITILTDGDNPPNLMISDREIKDSKITYSVYSTETINEKQKLIEYFPKGVANTLRWIIILAMIFLSLGYFIMIKDNFKREPKRQKISFWILHVFLWVIIFCSILLWMF